MMPVLTYALTFVVTLGILVVVHEWGHFVAARMCGIRVDEFSIGFGPRALKIGKLGDTEYNVRWIPLGGFVKIAGMEPDEEPLMRAAEKVKVLAGERSKAESASPVDSGAALTQVPLIAENVPNLAETSEQKLRDETEGFYAHPVWQRAIVIFAGPLMSFVLGYVIIFGLMTTVGVPAGPALTRVAEVEPGSEAQRMGLTAGDTITDISGKHVISGDQMVLIIHGDLNKAVTLTVLRAGKTLKLIGTPHALVLENGATVGALGFMPEEAMIRYPLREGFNMTNMFTQEWFHQIGLLIRHHDLKEIRNSAGGPIFIAQKVKQADDAGGDNVPLLMAQLSMSLAVFNLLPIPILDGGHLLIFAIEAFRRGRRLTMEQQQNFMLAGLAVIGVLFVLIMFNDILRSVHPGAQ
jgi:regulator of sigma E protease